MQRLVWEGNRMKRDSLAFRLVRLEHLRSDLVVIERRGKELP
jgi:hypothetical protein